ncbi:MAG: tRNA (adenosine(37)-N6)-threonylcarbamoyltransferase complex dimerization subunit type 1 TsaB [Phycisphaeraceae bacterium]
MRSRSYNLAIETASRHGSLALGRGDELLATVALPVQRRHRVGLLPGIAAICAEHDVTAGDLGELYVSLGPGSFTGLRVAMASAATLSLAQPVKIVGVPTLEALARNTPTEHERVAVCLNVKRGTAWSAVYEREGDGWRIIVEPALRSLGELLELAARPTALLGDPLPTPPEVPEPWPAGVTVLNGELARPRAEAVWRIGRERARQQMFIPPADLRPIYAREPEAVTLWNQRHAPAAAPSPNPKLEIRN